MKIYDYMTQGTCSQAIHIELNDDNTINNVSFTGGCNGNLKGIGKLVEGMPAEKVVEKLRGVTWVSRTQVVRTSSPTPSVRC